MNAYELRELDIFATEEVHQWIEARKVDYKAQYGRYPCDNLWDEFGE